MQAICAVLGRFWCDIRVSGSSASGRPRCVTFSDHFVGRLIFMYVLFSLYPTFMSTYLSGMIESKDLAFPKRFLAAHPSAAAAASSALDAPAGPESKLLE